MLCWGDVNVGYFIWICVEWYGIIIFMLFCDFFFEKILSYLLLVFWEFFFIYVYFVKFMLFVVVIYFFCVKIDFFWYFFLNRCYLWIVVFCRIGLVLFCFLLLFIGVLYCKVFIGLCWFFFFWFERCWLWWFLVFEFFIW